MTDRDMPSQTFQAKLKTPFALLGIRAEDGRVAEIVFLGRDGETQPPRNRLAERTCAQIERYVDDPDFRFDLPLAGGGTPFQRRVWGKIAAIESGRPELRRARARTGLGGARRRTGLRGQPLAARDSVPPRPCSERDRRIRAP
jgi:methylated-DNA-[protein]-cysteine S-methyltransferase